eukprot:419916-Prorocentrum_minimum.AAC.1
MRGEGIYLAAVHDARARAYADEAVVLGGGAALAKQMAAVHVLHGGLLSLQRALRDLHDVVHPHRVHMHVLPLYTPGFTRVVKSSPSKSTFGSTNGLTKRRLEAKRPPASSPFGAKALPNYDFGQNDHPLARLLALRPYEITTLGKTTTLAKPGD